MRPGLLLAVLAIPITANAELVEIKWSGGAFAHQATVAPKKHLEVCGRLLMGTNVAWQFRGSGPSDFNIHYHVGKEVSYPEKGKDVADGGGTLLVPVDQDYCWMWSNRGGQALEIDLILKRTSAGRQDVH